MPRRSPFVPVSLGTLIFLHSLVVVGECLANRARRGDGMIFRAAIVRPVVLLGALVNRPIDLRFASSALSRSTPLCTFKEPTLVQPPHPATLPPEDVQRDCAVTHTKGSGPGGQHRNKVQTAVVLKHQPTGLSAMWKPRPEWPKRQPADWPMLAEARGRLALEEARGEPAGRGLSLLVFHIGLSGSASDSRSQIQNHAAALFRLRLRFALELRSPLTELPEASALWRGRCDKAGRLKVNDEPVSQPVSPSLPPHSWARSTRVALLLTLTGEGTAGVPGPK